MRKYTLGFIFTPDFSYVLLIHKLSPEWQKGLVNGIGGKVEEGESDEECIMREVFEETALAIEKEHWKRVGTLKEPGGEVAVFTSIYKGEKQDAKSNDKEKIEWCLVSSLPSNVISNLHWLIPLSLDVLQNEKPKSFTAEY